MEVNLETKDLTAGYGKDPVLKDINLCVKVGSICGLMGRNGSGKTTLIRCINRIIEPMYGIVRIMNADIGKLTRTEIARMISVVPQGNHAIFPFTCLEMVLMGGTMRIKAWSSPGKKDIRKAYHALREVGIEKMADRPFNQLSGGERQLVMLARALCQDAPIMLLDEPNTHLDFSNQHKIMKLIRDIVKKRGVTALITLHDPNLVLYYCDEVIMLKDGQAFAHGATSEIMQDTLLQKVLGENIQCDATVNGLHVVTPRGIGE